MPSKLPKERRDDRVVDGAQTVPSAPSVTETTEALHRDSCGVFVLSVLDDTALIRNRQRHVLIVADIAVDAAPVPESRMSPERCCSG